VLIRVLLPRGMSNAGLQRSLSKLIKFVTPY
jgi:hypothetical protein